MTALDAEWLRAHPLPQPGNGGKDDRGCVLVVGGELDLVGAVLLSGTAALRAGAGKLQVAGDAEAAAALIVALPEARVLGLPQNAEDLANPASSLNGHAQRCDALLIGPGMVDDRRGLAKALISRAEGRPMVLDAGALCALGPGGEHMPKSPLVLTPHAGEMARLLDCDKAEIERDPKGAAQTAAGRFGACVALKGAQTHIVAPDGSALLYSGGGAGLGTSGSGDVLSGLLAGLLARGAAPFVAAAWAVILHGEAGKRLASRIGPLGFLAREIAGEVPSLLKELS
jgi:ADP-dependent NAD(P)H-hydrate dehydratase